MKFRLEADPAELPGKVGLLLDELAHRLAVYPDAANVLHKAANDLSGQEQLHFPVALEIARKWHDGYARHIVLMQQAIGKVLDAAADESAMGKSLDPYDPFGCSEPPEMGGDWVELPEDVALILMVDLEKARPVPKYIRRIFNPTPPPKYRYFYNVTGGAGLGHQSELSEGSAFAFEHNGQAGHYHVKKVEGEQVTAEHSGSGHQLQMHRNDFTKLLRDHHIGKIRDAIGKVAAQRQKMTEAAGKREKKLREMFPEHAGEATQQAAPQAAKPAEATPEAAPAPAAAAAGQAEAPPAEKPAPAAAPAPEKAPGEPAAKLPRAGMHELGGGGYDAIESVGLSAEELEQQAAAMPKDREYAVIPQSKGFVLVSRSKTPAGKEAVGGKTNVLLKNESGSGLQELPAEWVVMEAGDIVASHNAMTFDKRADYPEGVQERRYHEIKDEQLKIDRIARNKATPTLVANTNPDAINGAPVVTEHGVVLGGNGRTMGMQRAYEMYPEQAQKLKEYLASQASQFGLRGSQIMGMQRPILVRRVQAGQETDKLTRLGRRMNESLTQGLDPRAEEVAVSKFVSKDLVQSLTTHMEPDQTLADFLQKGQSLPFIKDLEHAGIIDATNRAQYVNQDTGLLNEHGRSRVSRVLAARMIPDPTLLDNMDQSLRNNLAMAVPFMLAAEEKGWDLREPLLMAVKADHEMSAKGYPRDVNGRDSYIRQPALFGDKESVRKKVEKNPAASALLEILQDHNGPKKLQAGFKSFAMEADAQAHDYGAQGSMFARPKVSQDQALAQAFKLKSGPTPEKKLAASWRGVFDLVKAQESPQQARIRAMHALNWEADRLVSGAHLVSHRHETEIDWQALANKLEAFVDEHKRREPELREALRDVDRDQLLELLQAHGQLRGHAAPESMRKAQAGPFIGPRGGMWADAQHTQHWEPPQPELFSPGEHQSKVEILHSSKIVAQDPALTPEQKAKPVSPALQEIQKRVSTDLREWRLPAGARVSDPWELPKIDPSATWSHPDYGSGTGAAPWQQGEDWTPDLHKYDCILVNSSAGKDSQAMLTHVVEQADKLGYPRSKIVVVHCDLGRVEWEGTKDLARAQAEHYGLRFEVVKRQQNDLVEHIEAHGGDLNQRKADTVLLFEAGVRTWQDLANATSEQVTKIIGADKGQGQVPGPKRAEKLISSAKSKVVKKVAAGDAPIDFGGAIAWPDMKSRYCTSDHKRGPVMTLMTQLAAEHREKAGPNAPPMRILNALGIRAQESSGRAKMANFEREDATGRRVVDRWYPIHRWNERRVWETIERSGVPHHRAYNLGMRRLSCVFCVFATKEDLMIAAKHNADLFNTYLELEEKVGAKFTSKMSLAEVRDEIERRRSEGYELNDLAQWVKKALDLDNGALDLVKAEVSRATPDLVLLVLEAALARLRKDGQPIDTVALEWKVGGACVHLDSDVDSFHALYLPYPEAYNDSLVVTVFAKDHGFTFEEHNPPPPLDGETLEKAEAGPFIGPRGGKWADAAHTIPWHEDVTSSPTGVPDAHSAPSHGGEATSPPTGVPEAHPVGRVASEYPTPEWAQKQGFNEPWRSTWYSFGEKAPEHSAKHSIDLSPEFNWKVNEVGAYKAREMLREQFKDVKPEPGHQLVYRIGSSEGALHNRNAGSLEGVLDHLMSGEESPGGKKLTAYSVKLPEQFGEYQAKRGAFMQKAKQLFIGPKGGKWADAKHTIHWEPDQPGAGGPKPPVASTILAFLHAGGKVRPHDTEPGKAVLKIAMEKKHHLEALKQESGLSGQIEHGPNKARLVVTADDAKKLIALGGYTPKPPMVAKPPSAVAETPPAPVPESKPEPAAEKPKVSEFKVTAAADWTHDKALDAITADTGLTREQVREALQGPASPKENARMKRRVQIETALLKTGLAHENALSKLLAEHQDQKVVTAHLNTIVFAGEKGMAAALEQYKSVPLYDLQVLSGVKVSDKPIQGYAVCYMNERRLAIGIRPETGTWATGDFRHELGHAIHGGCLGSALDAVINAHYKAVKAALAEHGKAPMKGPQSSDWYEEKIGVTGKRGLDDAKEDWAEHYRCYHRAWYQEHVLHAKKKGSASLAEYRNRHPEMAAVMDARYTAALLGQLAGKGAW